MPRPMQEQATPRNPAGSETEARLVTIDTDVLKLIVDTHGGDLVRAELKDYPQTQTEGAPPFVMLNRSRERFYVAQSGLIGADGTDRSGQRPVLAAERRNYALGEAEALTVPLRLETEGVTITKEFVVRKGDYLVEVRYRVENRRDRPGWGACSVKFSAIASIPLRAAALA